VSPSTVKIIPREGMPNQKNPSQKGVMKVKFDIQFPVLSDNQKRELKRVFSQR
jgi:DnaJ homolog subfamily B member 4